MTYLETINQSIIPFINNKIDCTDEPEIIRNVILEVTKGYVDMDLDLFENCSDVNDIQNILEFKENDKELAMVYILASVYVLALVGEIDNSMLYFDIVDEGELDISDDIGFKETESEKRVQEELDNTPKELFDFAKDTDDIESKDDAWWEDDEDKKDDDTWWEDDEEKNIYIDD